MRLIDADALEYTRVRVFHGLNEDGPPCVGGWNAVVMSCAIKEAPTINPADLVPKGRWVDNHCTACGMTPLGEELWGHLDIEPPRFELCMDFCPNCGADMRGGGDG